jgi:hypothetical protein
VTGGHNPHDPVDRAIVQLVRLVVDDVWAEADAAGTLIQKVPEPDVLRRARARVLRANSERPGLLDERALATLDAALALLADGARPSAHQTAASTALRPA